MIDYGFIDGQALAVRAKLQNYTNAPPELMYSEFQMTKGAIGALIGHLHKALGGDDERYLVCGWIFADDYKPMRSGALGDEQWYAIYKWVEFWKNEDDGKWYPREGFVDEALAVYSAAVRGIMADSVEEQERAGVDSMGVVNNSIALGGRVTAVVSATEEEAPTVESKPVVVPKSLRNTRFGRNKLSEDKERRILKELGYDPDEEPFEGF